MEYFNKSLHKVCGRQWFVVVNVVVVALNLCLGVVVNVAGLWCSNSPQPPPPPLTTTLAAHHNTTLMGVEGVLSSAHGLSDSSGNFTTHAFVWAGKGWRKAIEGAGVCLATHASPDRLHWVAIHARRWTGPISVSIFASGRESAVAANMVEYLRRCVDGVKDRVSFHLIHPRSYPPERANTPVKAIECGDEVEVNSQVVTEVGYSEEKFLRYPQNLLRNLAWRACNTRYTLNVDVDMITPPHMYTRLSAFLYGRVVCGRCAWVVPGYEVDSKVPAPPENKTDLLAMLGSGSARRYHVKVYEKNQGNSNLDLWEVNRTSPRPPRAPYTILYNITTYEEFWEPVLVLPRGTPGFDERFVGYGFTRSSQVYELHIRGFHFGVLDEAYLTHLEFQSNAAYPPSRHAQIQINHIRYQMFKKELHARLGLPQPRPLSLRTSRLASRFRLDLSGSRPRLALNGLQRKTGGYA